MVVNENSGMERLVVSGVTHDKNQARITLKKVPDQPGIAAKIFSPISDAGIVVDMIIQTSSTKKGFADLAFTVPKSDFAKTLDIIKQTLQVIGGEKIIPDENIAKVSIVGTGMRSHSGVASTMFGALAKEGINIMMISTSEIKISCVIESKYTELAVRALHDAFQLDKKVLAADETTPTP